MTGARFTGWPDEALDFFEGLEADNNKAYWQDHRVVYDRSVRGPMERLAAEIEAEFGPMKIFRPYRDVRFSADKSPYKTEIAATSGPMGHGGYYLHFAARGMFAAAGAYMMSRDQLARYRAAVDGAAGSDLEAIAAKLAERGVPLEGQTLKRAPKDWPADHPRIGLLRHTSLIVGREWSPARWMATRAAKDRIVGVWREAAPLLAWVEDNVGPAAEERRR